MKSVPETLYTESTTERLLRATSTQSYASSESFVSAQSERTGNTDDEVVDTVSNLNISFDWESASAKLKRSIDGGQLFMCMDLATELCQKETGDWDHLAKRLLPYGVDLEWLRQQHDGVQSFLQELMHQDTSWHVVSAGRLKSWYKQTKGTRIHSLKFEAPFDNVHLHQLLAMAREFDLMKQWNRYCTDCAIISEPGPLEAYVYASIWLPYPFAHPDSILRTQGWDLSETHGCFVVTVETVTEQQLPEGCKKLPKERKKRKAMTAHRGTCVLFKPLPPAKDGSPRVHGAVVAHIDPDLPMVPSWLVEFVMTLMTPLVYKTMQRIVVKSFKDSNSEFSRRVAARDDLYPLLQALEEKMYAHHVNGGSAEGSILNGSTTNTTMAPALA